MSKTNGKKPISLETRITSIIFVAFVIFILVLTARAYNMRIINNQSITVFSAGTYIMEPHALLYGKPINISTLSQFYCFLKTNATGINILVIKPPMNGTPDVLYATNPNVTETEFYGQLKFGVGSYIIALYNNKNYTVKAEISQGCIIMPEK